MRAFVRFSFSHISFPSLDRIGLWSIDLLVLDAPAPLKATLPRASAVCGSFGCSRQAYRRAGARGTATLLNAHKSASKRGVQWAPVFGTLKQIPVEAKGDLS
jgi:hypothetical protein